MIIRREGKPHVYKLWGQWVICYKSDCKPHLVWGTREWVSKHFHYHINMTYNERRHG